MALVIPGVSTSNDSIENDNSVTPPEGEYNNPSYRVTLSGSGVSSVANLPLIQAYLPETISFNLNSEWDSLMNSFAGIMPGGLGDSAKSFFDAYGAVTGHRSFLRQFSTFPAWKGNGPLEFTIPFVFSAIEDARRDVLNPMVALMKLVCPDLDGLLLNSPGPSFTIQNNNVMFDPDKIVNLSIGRYIYIRGVIITDVRNSVTSKFDINGVPMQAQVDVTLRTSFSPTKRDIVEWFVTRNTSYFQSNNYPSSVAEFANAAAKGVQEAWETGKKAYSLIKSPINLENGSAIKNAFTSLK